MTGRRRSKEGHPLGFGTGCWTHAIEKPFFGAESTSMMVTSLIKIVTFTRIMLGKGGWNKTALSQLRSISQVSLATSYPYLRH